MPVTLKSAIVATTCTVNSVVNPMPAPAVPVVQQVISTPAATKTVATLKKDPCASAATFDVGVCGTEKYYELLLSIGREMKNESIARWQQ